MSDFRQLTSRRVALPVARPVLNPLAPAQSAASVARLYCGQRVALLTQHGKERVIAPVLDAALDCRVERVGKRTTTRYCWSTTCAPMPIPAAGTSSAWRRLTSPPNSIRFAPAAARPRVRFVPSSTAASNARTASRTRGWAWQLPIRGDATIAIRDALTKKMASDQWI